MTYPERSPAAEAYVRRIRNKAKQAYARAWYTYCLGLNEKPERGTFAPLSVMGAQAVRMRLAEFGIAPPGCVVCGAERPAGYGQTCGKSACQEINYRNTSGYDGPSGSNREDV